MHGIATKAKNSVKRKKKGKNGMRTFVLVEDDQLINVSSSDIRRDCMKGTGYKGLVKKGWITSAVADYLETNQERIFLQEQFST